MSNEEEKHFSDNDEPYFNLSDDAIYESVVDVIFNEVMRDYRRSRERRRAIIPSEAPLLFEYTEYRTPRAPRSTAFDNIVNGFVNTIFQDIISDPIDRVTARSFDEQPTLEKNREEMKFDSSKYKDFNVNVGEKEKSCCICLIDYEEDDDVSLVRCNHYFHTDCIKEWTTYKTSCPVCRKELESQEKDDEIKVPV